MEERLPLDIELSRVQEVLSDTISAFSEIKDVAEFEFDKGLQMFLGDCFFFVCGAPFRRVDGFFPASLGILSPISCDRFKPFLAFLSLS